MTYKPCKSCSIDKLNAAFAALRARGLIAKQMSGCCAGCNEKALKREASAEPTEVRGAVFYTRQSRSNMDSAFQHAERLDARGDPVPEALRPALTLSFGAVGRLNMESIARVVVETLRAHDLDVVWDGRATTTISVRM